MDVNRHPWPQPSLFTKDTSVDITEDGAGKDHEFPFYRFDCWWEGALRLKFLERQDTLAWLKSHILRLLCSPTCSEMKMCHIKPIGEAVPSPAQDHRTFQNSLSYQAAISLRIPLIRSGLTRVFSCRTPLVLPNLILLAHFSNSV